MGVPVVLSWQGATYFDRYGSPHRILKEVQACHRACRGDERSQSKSERDWVLVRLHDSEVIPDPVWCPWAAFLITCSTAGAIMTYCKSLFASS